MKKYTIPIIAILAMVFALGVGGALIISGSNDAHRNCVTLQKISGEFDLLIHNATHPASLAGKPITAAQRTALDKYADDLRHGLPERPNC